MIAPRLFLLQAVLGLLLAPTAFAERRLLQRDNSLVNGPQACGPLDPKSVDAPDNALLYLSLRGSGVITYKCVEANKPVVLEEEADLTETLSKGWTGKVETKDGARYDFDPEDDLPGVPPNMGLIITTRNGNVKPPATNEFVLGPDPTSRRVLNGAPTLRWEVVSNSGASAAAGGIPSGVNYVTRTQAEGGAPPRSCDAGETVKSPYSAAYNIYTCDPAYLVQPPAAGPIASAVAPSVDAPAPARAPALTVAPVPAPAAEVPTAAPIAVPPVAMAPEPTVAPIPVMAPAPVVVIAPVPSESSAFTMCASSVIAMAGLAYLL